MIGSSCSDISRDKFSVRDSYCNQSFNLISKAVISSFKFILFGNFWTCIGCRLEGYKKGSGDCYD